MLMRACHEHLHFINLSLFKCKRFIKKNCVRERKNLFVTHPNENFANKSEQNERMLKKKLIHVPRTACLLFAAEPRRAPGAGRGGMRWLSGSRMSRPSQTLLLLPTRPGLQRQAESEIPGSRAARVTVGPGAKVSLVREHFCLWFLARSVVLRMSTRACPVRDGVFWKEKCLSIFCFRNNRRREINRRNSLVQTRKQNARANNWANSLRVMYVVRGGELGEGRRER